MIQDPRNDEKCPAVALLSSGRIALETLAQESFLQQLDLNQSEPRWSIIAF